MLTCRSFAEVLASTNGKAETVVSDDKDLSRTCDNQNDLAVEGRSESNGDVRSSAKETESNIIDDVLSPRRGRVSKRVQSQAITSEKQNERRAKRSSAEYCLLAGVLSCTSKNPIYRNMLETDPPREKLPTGCIPHLQGLVQAQTGDRESSTTAPLKQQNEFSATSSLITFIQSVCKVNSGPADALEKFLVHVSLNVSDVFGSENADTMSSCVIDCKYLPVLFACRIWNELFVH